MVNTHNNSFENHELMAMNNNFLDNGLEAEGNMEGMDKNHTWDIDDM